MHEKKFFQAEKRFHTFDFLEIIFKHICCDNHVQACPSVIDLFFPNFFPIVFWVMSVDLDQSVVEL